MDDVWECGDEAKRERTKIKSRSAAPDAKNDKGCDRDAGDTIAVNIIITQQIKLEK